MYITKQYRFTYSSHSTSTSTLLRILTNLAGNWNWNEWRFLSRLCTVRFKSYMLACWKWVAESEKAVCMYKMNYINETKPKITQQLFCTRFTSFWTIIYFSLILACLVLLKSISIFDEKENSSFFFSVFVPFFFSFLNFCKEFFLSLFLFIFLNIERFLLCRRSSFHFTCLLFLRLEFKTEVITRSLNLLFNTIFFFRELWKKMRVCLWFCLTINTREIPQNKCALISKQTQFSFLFSPFYCCLFFIYRLLKSLSALLLRWR